jgi:hypothetical protein
VHQLTFSASQNNEGKIFTFYSVNSNILELYKTIILNGSIISSNSTNEIHPLTLQLKSSSVSNDVYLVWRNEGSNYLSYQQYDAVPLAPQNLAVTVSSSNHPLLSWSKNNEPDINYYTIERSPNEGYSWDSIGETSNSFYEDQTLFSCTDPWCIGTFVWYRVKAIDLFSKISFPSNEVEISIDFSISPWGLGKGKNQMPHKYFLRQNYPNPFNPTTKISYSLQKEGLVAIKVYDVLGNEVAELVNEVKTEGKHEVEFNAVNLPSGI